MEQNIYLADGNTIVGSPDAAAQPQETNAATAAPSAQPFDLSSPSSLLSNPNTQLILTMVLVFGIMYFFMIRPQRKREKEIREIQSKLQTGDWVVTFSGMFGKVVDVGADVIMVEFGTNKGVRIPVRKSEVTKTAEPVLSKKAAEEEKK